MRQYVDMDGVENVAVGVIRQAKRDFIKGAKILYSILKKIPTEKELREDPTHMTLANDGDVRQTYDSWRFVIRDPYSMFGDVGEDAVINQWKIEAIEAYYRELYLPGATELYLKKAVDVHPHALDDKDVEKLISGSMLSDFIAARNYILTTPNGKSKIEAWNSTAYERSKNRKKGKSKGRTPINKTVYSIKASKNRAKNIERAKELYEAGISKHAIAKELGVGWQCVNNYLRSSIKS